MSDYFLSEINLDGFQVVKGTILSKASRAHLDFVANGNGIWTRCISSIS